jgi:hypothetical protein
MLKPKATHLQGLNSIREHIVIIEVFFQISTFLLLDIISFWFSGSWTFLFEGMMLSAFKTSAFDRTTPTSEVFILFAEALCTSTSFREPSSCLIAPTSGSVVAGRFCPRV